MILVSMQVAVRNGPTITQFFQLPAGPDHDLKGAWLRNCGISIFDDIVRGCDMTNVFPLSPGGRTYKSHRSEKYIGYVKVRALTIHDASVPPSYEVMVNLINGVNYCDVFECNVFDLIARIQEKVSDRKCMLYQTELLQAIKLVTPLDLAGQETRPNAFRPVDIEYAGVKIGTFSVRKVT